MVYSAYDWVDLRVNSGTTVPPYRGGIRLGNAMRTLKSYLPFLPPLLPIVWEVWQSLSPKFKGGSEHVESLWKWDEV
jgi:hypothetical protein